MWNSANKPKVMHSVEVTPDTDFWAHFSSVPRKTNTRWKLLGRRNPGPWLSEPILFQPSLYIKLKACSKPKLSRQSHCRSSRTKYSPLSRPSQQSNSSAKMKHKASLFLPAGDSLQSGRSCLLICGWFLTPQRWRRVPTWLKDHFPMLPSSHSGNQILSDLKGLYPKLGKSPRNFKIQ